jgi:hypothetical protein
MPERCGVGRASTRPGEMDRAAQGKLGAGAFSAVWPAWQCTASARIDHSEVGLSVP